MIVRVDDVNPNTDFEDFYAQLAILSDFFDEIWLGVNLISKKSDNGAVYPDLPLRKQALDYFYNVDSFLSHEVIENLLSFPKVRLLSHGLIHTMHDKISKDAAEMSILTSCSMLGSNKFIPPFNSIGPEVKEVCEANGIEIVGNDENRLWHSLETEKFRPNFDTWYYHPWRLSAPEIEERLSI